MSVAHRRSDLDGPRVAGSALCVLLVAFAIGVGDAQLQQAAETAKQAYFRVTPDRSLTDPVSGRLLLFFAPPSGDGSTVDINMMSPEAAYVAAKEMSRLAPGESVDLDADDQIFPRPLSQAALGSYRAQAVLDVRHSYNYDELWLGPSPCSTLVPSKPSIFLPWQHWPKKDMAASRQFYAVRGTRSIIPRAFR